MLEEKLKEITTEALEAIETALSNTKLDELRQKYLGKKGFVSQVLKDIGKAPKEERPKLGKLGNTTKKKIESALEAKRKEILEKSSFVDDTVDLTVPGIKPEKGALHPITQMAYDLNEAFLSLGFSVYQEKDITSELFAFDYLNFPKYHPARETMDTYWLEAGATSEDLSQEEVNNDPAKHLCLRPHLTGASVRYLKEHGAPARFVYPGQVYRNESIDASHERAFFQYEALIVDKDFSFASGRLLIETILTKVFGHEIPIRMRSGYFPFVEPGFEIDMQCQVCQGEGCSVCNGVGWIEVMPGGIPHPNVFKAAGLDPKEWSGCYINIGLDRLVMMRYGIDDVRLFHSTDLRFLEQYK